MWIGSTSAQKPRPHSRNFALPILAVGMLWSNASFAQEITAAITPKPPPAAEIIFVRSTGELPLAQPGDTLSVAAPSATNTCNQKVPNNDNWQIFKNNYVPIPAAGISNLDKSSAILGGQLSKLPMASPTAFGNPGAWLTKWVMAICEQTSKPQISSNSRGNQGTLRSAITKATT
jgi:hypothetical protein